MVFPKNMTLTEKLNMLFPNKEAFTRAVEAMGPMDDDYDTPISPRGSIPAGCFRMAMEMRMGAGAREARAPYGARGTGAKGKK